jgi:hypothetical protein
MIPTTLSSSTMIPHVCASSDVLYVSIAAGGASMEKPLQKVRLVLSEGGVLDEFLESMCHSSSCSDDVIDRGVYNTREVSNQAFP